MTEYSEQFDKERRYRVQVSFHKYGHARENFASERVDTAENSKKLARHSKATREDGDGDG